MRRIERADCPEALTRLRAAADNRITDAIAKGKVSRLGFSSHVYGHDDVRAALDAMHHGKCAYCEATLRSVTTGDIEHFRPKGKVRNETTGKDMQPGYYWLAYAWENLLLACNRCNQKHKGGQFPLTIEGDRQRGSLQTLPDTEVKLLLNPCDDDTRSELKFRRQFIHAPTQSFEAAETIRVIGLDKNDLNTARQQTLTIVQSLIFVAEAGEGELRDNARKMVMEYFSARGHFASCINDNFDFDASVASWRHEIDDFDESVGPRPV